MQAPVQSLSAVILSDKSDPVSFLKEVKAAVQNLKSASDGRKQAIAHLDQVSKILAAKVTVVQANEFRGWLASLASKVAAFCSEFLFESFACRLGEILPERSSR